MLRRMLNLGYETGKVAQVPFFPTIEVANVRAVFFSDEEYEALRDTLPTVLATMRQIGNDWLIPYVILIRWIGTRRGEVLRLERRQVNLDAGPDPETGEDTGTITLDPGTTKNDEGRVIYLPPEALAALRAWDAQTRELERERGIIIRHVFHRRGKRIAEFPYDVWHAAVVAANIGERRFPARLPPHRRPQLPPARRRRRGRDEDHRPQEPRHVRPLQHQERCRYSPCGAHGGAPAPRRNGAKWGKPRADDADDQSAERHNLLN